MTIIMFSSGLLAKSVSHKQGALMENDKYDVTTTSRPDRHGHRGGGSIDISGFSVKRGYASFSMVIPGLLAPFLSLSVAVSFSDQEGVLVSRRLWLSLSGLEGN